MQNNRISIKQNNFEFTTNNLFSNNTQKKKRNTLAQITNIMKINNDKIQLICKYTLESNTCVLLQHCH